MEKKTNLLNEKANNIRKHIVSMLANAGSGHPGGSLSAADIMSALYFHAMKYDVSNPKWQDRDYFVLSKGHAAPCLYAALAEAGFIDESELMNLRKLGAMLQGHPDMKRIPGVDASTGSLGQGVSIACGIALSMKYQHKQNRVYTILGDGELNEGIVWEALMSAAHYKLDNLLVIVDNNGLQIDGPNDEVMCLGNIYDKFTAFGFNTVLIDGHDMESIVLAIDKAREFKGEPTAIIAKTIKGKGVSFMENVAGWHGKAPSADELKQALSELNGEVL